jgi:hypothetical protein
MLRHSKKFCINGCQSYVWARDRCLKCYRKEILYPKQLAKPKKVYKIKNASPKRVLLNDEYTRIKKEKWSELISEGKNRCFFTDILLDPKGPIPDFHHVIGRDNSLLTDKQFIFPALFKPHREYHDLKHEYKELEKVDWYFPWLERMKTQIPIIYFKEMKCIERANTKVKRL